jgi:fermentation-respiration switch protein FrsA (DUF1100 family)
LWRILCSVAIFCVTVVLLMVFFEERFIFFPQPYDGSPEWRPMGIEYEDVTFSAADGTRLHGWYFPHRSPRAAVLHCHGNGGNITGRIEVARRLHQLGASVLLFDYRGYGRSEGRPTEAGVAQDARAARALLAERAGLEETEIVVLGRSLGGAVAVELAARDGARGLILESSFTELADIAAIHYPFLPVRLLLRNRFDALKKLPDYHGELLQVHGTADRLVPLEFGRKLFEASGQIEGEGKTFFLFNGGDHNELPPPAYYEEMDRFFERLP